MRKNSLVYNLKSDKQNNLSQDVWTNGISISREFLFSGNLYFKKLYYTKCSLHKMARFLIPEHNKSLIMQLNDSYQFANTLLAEKWLINDVHKLFS